mgnify:CR=1 FL=1
MSKLYTRSLFHYETDTDGVCHFSNYFRIAEEAFYDAFRDKFPHLAFAVVESQAQYLRPLRFGSIFQVAIEKKERRRSNFELLFTIQENKIPSAHIKLRFVSIEPKQWEVIALPEQLKEELENYAPRPNFTYS